MKTRTAVDYVGVLGATSLVGSMLLNELKSLAVHTIAFSRRPPRSEGDEVQWCQLLESCDKAAFGPRQIPLWVSLMPIWVLPQYFDALRVSGVKRVVVLSSTSRFTKTASSVDSEQALARRLADAENALIKWAETSDIEYVILRPTLIYGGDHDGNIAEIARFIRRFGIFPVCGAAQGLRQPVRAADIAKAIAAAISVPAAANQAYNLSGGETLSYRDLVARVFASQGLRPRIFTVPLVVFRLAFGIARCVPRYRNWTVGMAERMNEDLVFPHDSAQRDLGYEPSVFEP